ncbi:DNA polymerase beta domain protein region [endosymbiont GvMRE of Glomus versiforme]|nr:DNA polymerase beta domain protein region [endosymbiont GvMRE of Glomus versiforme]
METRHQEIIRSILAKYPYKFYAYGSRVKNQAKKYSDLDVCYYEEMPWNTFSHLKEDLEKSYLPFKVDLVYWEWMTPEFQKMIKGNLVPISQ